MNILSHYSIMLSSRLFRWRYASIVAVLFIILYCNLYWWLFIPYSAFKTQWRPDHILRVSQIEDSSIAASYLQAGDKILAVNDRPVKRSSIFFPPIMRNNAYDLRVQRDGSEIEALVPFLDVPDEYALAIRVAPTILSMVSWAVAAIALYYAWRENRQAIWLGYIFLLASVVVISWTGTLMGVPLMWITSQPFLFLLAVGWVYLGLLPHYKPFGRKTYSLLKLSVFIAILLGIVAFLEGLLLFPSGTSVQDMIGVSIYKLGAAAQALGGVTMLVLIVARRYATTSSYLRQQLNILLVLVSIGFLPAILFSFIPLAFWGDAILPMPLAMVGLIAVPLGYLYVIFRHAYLDLDGTFGRITPYTLLIITFAAVYGLGLYALNQRYGDGLSLILPAVLLFVVLAALAPASARLLTNWIQRLFFGRAPASPAQLNRYANELAHQPDLATLEHVIANMCTLLDVPKTTLSIKNGSKLLKPTAAIGRPSWSDTADDTWLLDCTIIRTVQKRQGELHPIFNSLPWAEVALPLRVREQTLGLWVLARPRDGYFNQEAIAFLEHAAATLAMGSEIIVLLDSAETLSREIISVQEEERRVFASQLHDQPLQRLAAVRMLLGQTVRNIEVTDKSTAQQLDALSGHLTDLDQELRSVYENAFPRIIEYGIEATILSLADQFQVEHKLVIETDLIDLEAVEVAADDRLAQVVYRIVQEALNNVVKHASATQVAIRAGYSGQRFELVVVDDGREQAEATLAMTDLLRQQHYGIAGMKSWARSVGGAVVVTSQGQGTTVALSVPLAR
jgi:signal transduction histidine kinase